MQNGQPDFNQYFMPPDGETPAAAMNVAEIRESVAQNQSIVDGMLKQYTALENSSVSDQAVQGEATLQELQQKLQFIDCEASQLQGAQVACTPHQVAGNSPDSLGDDPGKATGNGDDTCDVKSPCWISHFGQHHIRLQQCSLSAIYKIRARGSVFWQGADALHKMLCITKEDTQLRARK